jgi:O-antigen ligase
MTILLFGILYLSKRNYSYNFAVPNRFVRDFTIIALIYFFIAYYSSRNILPEIFDYEYLAIFSKFIFGPIVLCLSAYSSWEKSILSNKIFIYLSLINLFFIFCVFEKGISTGLIFGSLHSNQMGAFGCLTLCLGLIALSFDNKSYLSWALLVLALFVIIISLSRAAVIASLVGLVIYYFRPLLFNLKFLSRLVFGFVVVILCVVPFKLDSILKSSYVTPITSYIEKVTNKPVADNGRLKLWAYSTALISESPIYGHGVEARRSWNKTLSNGDEITLSPHNFYISVILETGLIGMALVFLLLLRVISLLTLYKTRASKFGLPVLIAILFHQAFATSLTTGSVMVGGYMWFILGAIVRLSSIENLKKL